MWHKIASIAALVFMSACTEYEANGVIPAPVISFFEGRDYWNNPIYIRSDTTVTGKKTRAIMAHFAAAGGIKKITVKQNGAVVLDKLEDNETKFNDEYLCPLTPDVLPATFVVLFQVEDWEGNVSDRTLTVNFK